MQDIPLGHTVALMDLEAGDTVIKYASTSAKWSLPIGRGSTLTCTTSRPSGGKPNSISIRRTKDAKDVGVMARERACWCSQPRHHSSGRRPLQRRHERRRDNIKGTLASPHPYGRLQFGEDLDLFFRTLIGTGIKPNVAAVVVIGIEEEWTRRVVDGIAETGKPVAGFSIELHGDQDTMMRASWVAREFVQWASELRAGMRVL